MKSKIDKIVKTYCDESNLGHFPDNYPNICDWYKGVDYALIGSPIENLKKDVINLIIAEGGTQPICNIAFKELYEESLFCVYTFSYLDNNGVLETYSTEFIV